MKLTETPLAGAYVVDIDPRPDERGLLARTFCADQMAEHGLKTATMQCSVSFNIRRGTLRGMHYQASPHEEVKLVRCTAGAVFDVIVDLRGGSRTYRQWFGAQLSAVNRRALLVPKGFAHGFISLADATEVFYMISARYAPDFARGFRWNDPQVGIVWPMRPIVIGERDKTSPLLDHEEP